MKKLAIAMTILISGSLISSCATSKGGSNGGKCPAYSQTPTDADEAIRS